MKRTSLERIAFAAVVTLVLASLVAPVPAVVQNASNFC